MDMLFCMRTTLDLDKDLLIRAKEAAGRSGRTLTALIEDALREVLNRRKPRIPRKPFRVRTFRGGTVLPGVPVNDNAALRDVMDGLDAPM
jgi:hypothetical protein